MKIRPRFSPSSSPSDDPSQTAEAALRPAKSPPRIVQLDLLRGLAILLVLGSHPPVPGAGAGYLAPIAATLESVGWSGVYLFFVLSGYLIGGLLFKELQTQGNLDIRRFYIRRCFRIWPAYYLALFVVTLIVLTRNHGDFVRTLGITYPNFLHLQNYLPSAERPLGQSWTLAIEEHFYLMLPLLLWLFTRKGGAVTTIAAVPITAVCLSVACTAARYFSFSHPPVNFFATHFNIDGLFWGVLLAYVSAFEPEKIRRITRYRGGVLLLAVLLIAPAFFFNRETSVWFWSLGFTMLYIGFGFLLLTLVNTDFSQGWRATLQRGGVGRFVAWVGYYSYTIYLWFGILGDKPTAALFAHLPIANPTLNWLCQLVTYLTLSIVSGVLIGKFVDRYSLPLRDRLFPSRSRIVS